MATNSDVNTDLTLGEAAGRFLATVKEQDRAAAQSELNRVVRESRDATKTSTLRASDIARYQEQVEQTGADAARRLEPLKNFFAFVHKQGGSEFNLGRFIKSRRSSAATRLAGNRPRAATATVDE